MMSEMLKRAREVEVTEYPYTSRPVHHVFLTSIGYTVEGIKRLKNGRVSMGHDVFEDRRDAMRLAREAVRRGYRVFVNGERFNG